MSAAKKKVTRPPPIEIPPEFSGTSDRACGIISGGILEERLRLLVQGRLVKGTSEPLMAGRYGPLASFAALIDVARALGLISESEASDLHQIRKIRNAFAHNLKPLAFTNSPVIDHVRQLHYRGSVLLNKPYENPRHDYEACILMLGGFLQAHLEAVRPLRPAEEFRTDFATMHERVAGYEAKRMKKKG